uniref:Uncharacterized protein n=1 Tax=Romanomermis culicivorax TaxID=13658 RepID=A0A915K6X6_ROMCU
MRNQFSWVKNFYFQDVLVNSTEFISIDFPKMGVKPRWAKFLNFAVRISLATLVGILYEDYWYDRNHLLGHLYYLNFHKVRGEEVEDKYQKAFNVTYPLQLRIALNAMTAMFLWYININK